MNQCSSLIMTFTWQLLIDFCVTVSFTVLPLCLTFTFSMLSKKKIDLGNMFWSLCMDRNNLLKDSESMDTFWHIHGGSKTPASIHFEKILLSGLSCLLIFTALVLTLSFSLIAPQLKLFLDTEVLFYNENRQLESCEKRGFCLSLNISQPFHTAVQELY